MVYLFTEDQRKQTEKRSIVFEDEFFLLYSSGKKYDSMQEILSKSKINTIYELFMKEVVHEVFRELRLESPLKFLNFEELLSFSEKQSGTPKGSSNLLMRELC